MKTTSQNEWTIQGMALALESDLLLCNTAFERTMCSTITGLGIQEKAKELALAGKLTPAGRAIAESFGFRG